MSGLGYGHAHISLDIIVCLVGWELPLFFQAPGDFRKEHFWFAPEESVDGDKKGVELIILVQSEEEVFFLLFLLLCLHQVFKWTEDVVFHICVCHFDINNGVHLGLPRMTYP